MKTKSAAQLKKDEIARKAASAASTSTSKAIATPAPEPVTVCFECDTPTKTLHKVPEGFSVCDRCLNDRRQSDTKHAKKIAARKAKGSASKAASGTSTLGKGSEFKDGAPAKTKTYPTCGCGCGETTRGGTYRPGHDARHHAALRAEGAREIELLKGGVKQVEPLTKKAKALTVNPNALWKSCTQAAEVAA